MRLFTIHILRHRRRFFRLLPIYVATHGMFQLYHLNSLTFGYHHTLTHLHRPIVFFLRDAYIPAIRDFRGIVYHTNIITLRLHFNRLIRHTNRTIRRVPTLSLQRTRRFTRLFSRLIFRLMPLLIISYVLLFDDLPRPRIMLCGTTLRLTMRFIFHGNSHFRRDIRLLRYNLYFITITTNVNIMRPIVLTNNTLQREVGTRLSSIHGVFGIAVMTLCHFCGLPSVTMKCAHRFGTILRRHRTTLRRLVIILLRLFFIRFANIFPRLHGGLLRVSNRVVRRTSTYYARRIMVLAIRDVISRAMWLASMRGISHGAFYMRTYGPFPRTLRNRVTIFILLPIPPIRGRVYTGLRSHGRHHLYHLTRGDPISLYFYPLRFHFIFVTLILPMTFHLYPMVTGNVHRGTMILRALNNRRNRLLRRFIEITLGTHPLRRNMIKLYLLSRLLVNTIRHFPVNQTTYRLHTFGLNHIILRMSLTTFPRNYCHRFIRPISPTNRPIQRLIRTLFHRYFLLTGTNGLTILTTTLTPIRRRISILFSLHFRHYPHLKQGILRGKCRYHRNITTRCNHYYKRTYHLHGNGTQIRHRRYTYVIPTRISRCFIGNTKPLTLNDLRINRRIVSMTRHVLTPLFLSSTILRIYGPFPHLRTTIRSLLRIPSKHNRTHVHHHIPRTTLRRVYTFFRRGKLSTLRTILRRATSLGNHIRVRTISLNHRRQFVRHGKVMIFRNYPLMTRRLRTHLISRLHNMIIRRLFRIHTPYPIVIDRNHFRHLRSTVHYQNPIHVHRRSRVCNLSLLMDLLGIAFIMRLYVQGRGSTIRRIIRTINIIRIRMRATRLYVNRFNFLSLRVNRTRIRGIYTQTYGILRFLRIFFSNRINGRLFTFRNSLHLPMLTIIRRLNRLFRLTILHMTTRRARRPLHTRRVRLVLYRRVIRTIRLSTKIITLTNVRLTNYTFYSYTRFFDLYGARHLIYVTSRVRHQTNGDLRRPRLVRHRKRVNTILHLLSTFTRPFLRYPYFLTIQWGFYLNRLLIRFNRLYILYHLRIIPRHLSRNVRTNLLPFFNRNIKTILTTHALPSPILRPHRLIRNPFIRGNRIHRLYRLYYHVSRPQLCVLILTKPRRRLIRLYHILASTTFRFVRLPYVPHPLRSLFHCYLHGNGVFIPLLSNYFGNGNVPLHLFLLPYNPLAFIVHLPFRSLVFLRSRTMFYLIHTPLLFP